MSSEQRAELVERMAEAIEQQFELGYTATAIDFASVALAAVEAAGGWPRPEPITEGERKTLIETARRIVRCSPCDFPYGPQYIPEAVNAVLAALPERHRRLVLGVSGE